MGLNILIAEQHEVLGVGLCTIFAEDPRVSNVHKVTTEEDLQVYIGQNTPDLIVVNQSLLRNISALQSENFVVLATDPSITFLKAAYKYGARGYLSINVSAGLLRTLLRPTKNSFLLEPILVPWVMPYIFDKAHYSVESESLTPREKEIVGLLCEGFDEVGIAQLLCIADLTLKTYIKNIVRKHSRGK